MTAQDLFQVGQLTAAIEAQTQEVKAQPADAGRRTFLFELLCFAGELDRAEKQLDVVGHQDAQTEWTVQVYRNILAAERLRRRLFADGVTPQFLLDPPAWVQRHLDAVNCLRDGRAAEAAAELDRAADDVPDLAGTADGQAFDEWRDCDDLVAPVLELIVQRDYIWLPYAQIRELEIAAPERPRDLIWTPVRVVLPDGAQRRGYVPVLYATTWQHADEKVRLGRVTDWRQAGGGLVQGQGQRTLLVGEDARGLMELRQVEFAAR